VLVIGGGAREHALCLALSQDPGVSELICAPGNAGIGALAQVRPVDVGDPAAVRALAIEVGADLVVIGPEVPLVAGAADAVRAAGIACFGPTREAACIEGSKAFAKDVMAAAGVPTGASRLCTSAD
jgi:phosphoribosylamine---glycine ligase